MNAEQAKFLADYFANVFQEESRTTAKVLAAVPDEGRDYRPDPKSRTAWELATHLALGDIWFLDCIINGRFDFDPAIAQQQVASLGGVEDLVRFYQREFPERLQALRNLPAEHLTGIVDFFGMMQWPNVSYLSFANNHSVHHRGQLASYLRAMGSKVPSIYGGSADEPVMAS